MTVFKGLMAATCAAAAFCAAAGPAMSQIRQAAPAKPVHSNQAAAATVITCPVDEVAVLSVRVHVRCAFPEQDKSGIGGQLAKALQDQAPKYFALPASDPMADWLVVLGNAALEHKGTLDIGYVDDLQANPMGCLDDCRRVVWIVRR